MIVLEVVSKDPPQMRFIEDNRVIHTLSTNRTNGSFDVWILPG